MNQTRSLLVTLRILPFASAILAVLLSATVQPVQASPLKLASWNCIRDFQQTHGVLIGSVARSLNLKSTLEPRIARIYADKTKSTPEKTGHALPQLAADLFSVRSHVIRGEISFSLGFNRCFRVKWHAVGVLEARSIDDRHASRQRFLPRGGQHNGATVWRHFGRTALRVECLDGKHPQPRPRGPASANALEDVKS